MSIRIESLSKSFGEQLAVDDISFSVEKGEIVGFLGPNGSGKSTTMRCICGILPADNGKIRIADRDIENDLLSIKKRIGYLPEHNPLPHDLYVKEYLRHIDAYYNRGKEREKRIEHIIDITGLDKEKTKKIGQLSKGYRQRVGLAQSMIHDPEILILDEPTTGLDPNQIIEIRNLISGLSKDKTVLLSTHILQEVEAICDRVVVLNKGKLVADGTASSLVRGGTQSRQTIYLEFNEVPDYGFLKKIPGVQKIQQISDKEYLIEGEASSDLREVIFRAVVSKKLVLLSLLKKEDTLEEAFRKLTQQN
jgi:ABC-2 type transport system ATP-binding protein